MIVGFCRLWPRIESEAQRFERIEHFGRVIIRLRPAGRLIAALRIENEKPVRVERMLGRCDSMGALTRGQNPSDLSAYMGVECRRSSGRLCDQACIPRVNVPRPLRPSSQGVPEGSEPVAAIEGNGLDAPVLPERRSLAAITFLKGEQPAPTTGTEIQGFKEILHGRIISSVANENDLEPCEQRLDEARRPAVREIGSPEIRARHHKLVIVRASILPVHAPVQVNDAAELPITPRIGQSWRPRARERRVAFLEQQIKVCGDEPSDASSGSGQVKHSPVRIEPVAFWRSDRFGDSGTNISNLEFPLK